MLVRLCRALFGEPEKRRSPSPHRSRRLGLERLEDRLAPANTLIWVGAAGANWDVNTSWNTNSQPQAGDTVIFDGRVGVGANTNSTMNLGGLGSFHLASLIFRNGYNQTVTLNSNLIVDVFNMDSPATITGAKSLTINQSTTIGTLPPATLFGASFWTQGTISTGNFQVFGDAGHPATFNFNGNLATSLETDFTIGNANTTVNWQSNDVIVQGGKTVTNNGVFNADAAGRQFGNNGGAGNKWTFKNNKTLNLGAGKLSNETLTPGAGSKILKVSSATPGASTFEISDAIVLAVLATIEVDNGTLQLDDALTQSDGTVTVSSGTTLSAVGLSLSGGTFSLSGGTLQSSADVQVLSGGTFSGSGEVTLAAGGTMENYGTVSIVGTSSYGVLHVTGNYTQTGTLNLDTEGYTYYDRLNITGLVTLGGTLNVTDLHGGPLWRSSIFQVLTYGSRSGTFGTVNLPALNMGGSWSTRYDDPAYPDSLTLWVI